jgi:hypothetical protein
MIIIFLSPCLFIVVIIQIYRVLSSSFPWVRRIRSLWSSSYHPCIFSIHCVFPFAVFVCNGRHHPYLFSIICVFLSLCLFIVGIIQTLTASCLSSFSDSVVMLFFVRCVLKLRHCQSRCPTVGSCSHSLQ